MVLEFARDVFLPLGQIGADAFDDTARWIDPNNRRFSDRLWLARQSDRDAIDAILRGAVASGDDPLQAAKRLEDYLTPVGRQTRTRTPRSGHGNYAARRLARTEVTRAFGQATLQAAALNPFVLGVKWNLSGGHDPKEDQGVCAERARGNSRGLPRGVYRTDEVPRYPSHPMCKCNLSPWSEPDADSVVAQLRRDFDLDPQPVRLFGLPQPSRVRELVTTLFRAAREFLGREAA